MEIKFISYDGEFPNLCSGQLVLEINGKIERFGHKCMDFESWHEAQEKSLKPHPRFWRSGGRVRASSDYSNMWTESGPWELDADELPEEFKPYGQQLIDIFNENVPWGCCGGCI